ncbi:MAG: hypothetical protein IJ209_03595 [Bacteroidaceae bacterium]|nr:hypothetical protein [Bacteroidaceae bacterium]
MKRVYLLLFIVMLSAISTRLSASEEYHEDMDSLLHKVEGHRQGVILVDESGAGMKIYVSTSFRAPNGKSYYRWWDGGRMPILYSVHDPEALKKNGLSPLPYGYLCEGDKIYAYNFLTDEEFVAYDFSLQPGEQFTTHDGIRWEVVGRRTEEFESMFEEITDYKNEHVVLSLKSIDGTKTDEWVQYIGSLHYPMQLWGRTDVSLVRTAFYNLGDLDDKLVCFSFNEDPIYGQLIDVAPGPNANTEISRGYNITAGNDSLYVNINYYTWFTRHYCYTYRKGDIFYIHSIELGPYRDGGESYVPSFGLTFTGAPSPDIPKIVYNGEELPASLLHLQESNKNSSTFDLSGRRLAAPPARGVFIMDGNKVVVK